MTYATPEFLDHKLEEKWQKAEAERDEALLHLKNLLAIIHRDGGHYTEKYGLEKATKDAHQVWAGLITKAEQMEEALATLNAAQFSPLGDNHHNAAACGYCGGLLREEQTRTKEALAQVAVLRKALQEVQPYFAGEHHYDHPSCVVLRQALSNLPAAAKEMAEKAGKWDELRRFEILTGFDIKEWVPRAWKQHADSQKENGRLRAALEEAMSGLEWWEKTYPESQSEADNEFKVRAQAALSLEKP